MDFFAGIDGTGVGDNALYAKDFAESFVHQLYGSNRFGLRYYSRGPTWEGSTTRRIAANMHREIETRLHSRGARPVSRIILAGYSRGGAAVIHLARELQAHKHTVDCLLLFDAVDMTWTLEAERIPANVRHVFHARRNPASRSRTSWGNCGKVVEDPRRTRYTEQFFLCTHGGMGGTPWKVADPDGIINESVTEQSVSDRLKGARNSGAARLMRRMPMPFPLVPVPPTLPLDAADAANDAHRRASRTTITLERDRSVSQAVGAWMFGNLDRTLSQKAKKLVPVG